MRLTIEAVLKDKVREARNQGADEDALKVFASMLEKADGDVYLAEKFAQTVPPKGRRLSAARAQAARMSWQGTQSFEALSATGRDENMHGEIQFSGSRSPALSLASVL